jgi:hypothetical protein
MTSLHEVESSEWTAIGAIVDRLRASHPAVAAVEVESVVRRQYSRFDGRPVRDYVPLFVERAARRELDAL